MASPSNSINLRHPEEGIVFGNGVDVEADDTNTETRDETELEKALKDLKEAMELVKTLTTSDEDISNGEGGETSEDAGLPFFAIFVFWALGMMAIATIEVSKFGVMLIGGYAAFFIALICKFSREITDFCCNRSFFTFRFLATVVLLVPSTFFSLYLVDRFIYEEVSLLVFIGPIIIPVMILILSQMWICANNHQGSTTNSTTGNPTMFWREWWVSVWKYISCQQLGSFILLFFPVYYTEMGFLSLLANIATTCVFGMRLANPSSNAGTNTNEESHENAMSYLDLYFLLIGGILLGPIIVGLQTWPLYMSFICFTVLAVLYLLTKIAIEYFQESTGSQNEMSTMKLTYPEDSYSFMALYNPWHDTNLFCFGFMVFIFQFVLLVLLLIGIFRSSADNPATGFLPNFIPANASPYVRAAQFVAIFAFVMFKDSNLDDITVAIELYPNLFRLDDDKKKMLALSSTLRLLQGILSVAAVAFLVMSSSEVIDIILNFTAINFVSQLDNIAFEVAKSGKFGPTMEKKASEITDKELDGIIARRSKHGRYMWGIFIISLILLAFILFIVALQERNDKWVTQNLSLEVDGESTNTLSGSYEITKGNYTLDKRHVYKKDDSSCTDYGLELQYCSTEQKWLFFNASDTRLKNDDYYYDDRFNTSKMEFDKILDPCKVLEKNLEIAHSSTTDSYDISALFDELWFNSDNSAITLFFDSSDKVEKSYDYFNSTENSILPSDLALLTDFKYFDRSRRCMTGTIPTEIGLLSSLKYLNLQHNGLTGNIPGDIGLLTDLTHLDLGYNIMLTGSFPFNISVLSRLRYFGLGGNPSLSIPNGLESLPFLSGLDLSNRGMKGSEDIDIILPLTGLKYLDLSSNAFSGAIATELGKLSLLTSLDLSNNAFSGAIATELGELSLLTSLDLSNNGFNYIIPQELGYLGVLENLNLSNNRLTGLFPWVIPYFQWELSSIDLSNNDLTGPMPMDIFYLTSLSSLDLSNNGLTGTLDEIGKLTNLEQLNLANNSLAGTLDEIGNLTNLEQLNLANNSLTGTLITQIGKLTNLELLNLANNSLTGKLITQIGKLKNLEQLDLRGNDFKGGIPREIKRMKHFENFLFDQKNLDG